VIPPHLRAVLLPLLLAALPAGCLEDPKTPQNAGALSEQAAKWLERSRASYRGADLEDARDAAQSALTNAPESAEVKVHAARVHLARLEFDEAKRLLSNLQTPEALALRGRARWYAGELEGAADDLEALLTDPQTKDDWAKTIARLARQGAGRTPFQVSGGLLAPVQMQRIRSAHMIVPLEINGESALALVATGRAEVVLDSSTRKEPTWIQLRFAERVEVRDVPALVEDLSGLSKEVGAPIKALLGVNLLRRLHVTFDFQGDQFVVRTKEPPPPPKATRVELVYAQGGAMVARALLRSGASEQHPLLINTLLPYPASLDERGLKLGGIEMAGLQPVPGDNRMKGGKLPYLRLGAFDLPEVPVVHGQGFTDIQAVTGMDILGAIGSGLLGLFRCTLTDGGRVLWVEDNDQVLQMLQQVPQAPPPATSGGAPPTLSAPTLLPPVPPAPAAPKP
jgi:predicted aspartyl protease